MFLSASPLLASDPSAALEALAGFSGEIYTQSDQVKEESITSHLSIVRSSPH